MSRVTGNRQPCRERDDQQSVEAAVQELGRDHRDGDDRGERREHRELHARSRATAAGRRSAAPRRVARRLRASRRAADVASATRPKRAGRVLRVRRLPQRGDDERRQQRERVQLDHRREPDGRCRRGVPLRRPPLDGAGDREREHERQRAASRTSGRNWIDIAIKPGAAAQSNPAARPHVQWPNSRAAKQEREQRTEQVQERRRSRGTPSGSPSRSSSERSTNASRADLRQRALLDQRRATPNVIASASVSGRPGWSTNVTSSPSIRLSAEAV